MLPEPRRADAPEPYAAASPGQASSSAAPPAPASRSTLRRKDDTAVLKPGEARASRDAGVKLIADASAWGKAKEEFKAAMLCSSSASSLDGRLATCERFVQEALGAPLLPLTEDKLLNLGAALRGVGYLSGAEYMRVAKAEHVACNWPWSGSLDRFYNRCLKATRRGRGPVTRAGLADVEAFARAPVESGALAPRGPVAASAYALTCLSFLLREIEGSLIAIRQVVPFTDDDGQGVRLMLPSSKVDFWGSGVARSLTCSCGVPGGARLPCVVCAVLGQLAVRTAQGAEADAPLFPDDTGRFPSQEGAVATLRALWVPVEGTISGHSPRRTGAQLLAALGVSDATITWFGRWGSSAVLAYIADARSRSRAGKRLWVEALAGTAGMTPNIGIHTAAGPAPAPTGAQAQPGAVILKRLEADRAAEPVRKAGARVERKTFVLNTETRRLHIFASGAAASLCNFFTLDKASALPDPVLQGRAWKGRDCSPCRRCRRHAAVAGLLQGGRHGGGAGSESSSSVDTSGRSD